MSVRETGSASQRGSKSLYFTVFPSNAQKETRKALQGSKLYAILQAVVEIDEACICAYQNKAEMNMKSIQKKHPKSRQQKKHAQSVKLSSFFRLDGF